MPPVVATPVFSAPTPTPQATPSISLRWGLVPKKQERTVFTRLERWDLERVSFVLGKLNVSSPPHHDVHILRHVKDHADKEGFLSVRYKYARDASRGRVYSGMGFQACSKETRAFCSARFYVEDDLVNSFPTIMSQVFKQAGLKTPFLDDYVGRREELFQELCTPALDRVTLKGFF